MDNEKKRKRYLILNGIAIPISVFALYTFIFIFDNGIGWKIALIIIGLGWLTSAISGFMSNLRKLKLIKENKHMQDIKNKEYVKCPRCKEEVYRETITCPFCNFGIMA